MRNTLPLLSRPPQAGLSQSNHSVRTNEITPTQQLPTIRFIAPTPSEPITSIAAVAPFASSPLAPRQQDGEPARKRLVPKKSKLGLLAAKAKEKVNKDKDFSDVIRRVGAETPSTGRSGFEIYVDHDEDADIVVVKKKKSRLGIDGMSWGALGEVTNVPSVPKEKKSSENLLKVKREDSQRWWSIGRGRKEVKEKEKSAEEHPPASAKSA
jgi:serine/arginine repetitive matrix protein 2